MTSILMKRNGEEGQILQARLRLGRDSAGLAPDPILSEAFGTLRSAPASLRLLLLPLLALLFGVAPCFGIDSLWDDC